LPCARNKTHDKEFEHDKRRFPVVSVS
jgi:hypothetical protein